MDGESTCLCSADDERATGGERCCWWADDDVGLLPRLWSAYRLSLQTAAEGSEHRTEAAPDADKGQRTATERKEMQCRQSRSAGGCSGREGGTARHGMEWSGAVYKCALLVSE